MIIKCKIIYCVWVECVYNKFIYNSDIFHFILYFTCGYGAKYQGLILCRPSSIISIFFILVTRSSCPCATILPDCRGLVVGVAVPLAVVSLPSVSTEGLCSFWNVFELCLGSWNDIED